MHVTPFSVGASRPQCLPDSKAGLAAAQPKFPQEPQDLLTEPKLFCPPFVFTAPSPASRQKGCPYKDTAMAQTHTEGTRAHSYVGALVTNSSQTCRVLCDHPPSAHQGGDAKLPPPSTWSSARVLRIPGLGGLSPTGNKCAAAFKGFLWGSGTWCCSSWAAWGSTWDKWIHKNTCRVCASDPLELAQAGSWLVNKGSDADTQGSCGVLS